MRTEIHSILLTADEKNSFEFPSKFDETSIETDAREYNTWLSEQGVKTIFEDWVYNQDASFGLAIVLETWTTDTSTGLIKPTIRFSNFGRLASITFESEIPDQQIEMLKMGLTNHGFVYVNKDELDSPYDGVNHPNQALPTWWVRYFDWL